MRELFSNLHKSYSKSSGWEIRKSEAQLIENVVKAQGRNGPSYSGMETKESGIQVVKKISENCKKKEKGGEWKLETNEKKWMRERNGSEVERRV